MKKATLLAETSGTKKAKPPAVENPEILERKQAHAMLVLKAVMGGPGCDTGKGSVKQIIEKVGHIELPLFDETVPA